MSLTDDLTHLRDIAQRAVVRGYLPPQEAAELAALSNDSEMARYAPPGSVARGLLSHIGELANAAGAMMDFINEQTAAEEEAFEQQNELNMLITTLDEDRQQDRIVQWMTSFQGPPWTGSMLPPPQHIEGPFSDMTHERRVQLDEEIRDYAD